MHINEEGLNLIKQFEGCKLQAYKDSGGTWTIGYGHTVNVQKGDTITKKQADEYLRKDVETFEKIVESSAKKYGYEFNENQFSALVSFAYNVGGIGKLTKYGACTKLEIPERMNLFIYSKGIRLNGLVRRRASEIKLYGSGKTYYDIAIEVLKGKWGNNPKRKEKLEKAGWNYNEVQRLVNELIRGFNK